MRNRMRNPYITNVTVPGYGNVTDMMALPHGTVFCILNSEQSTMRYVIEVDDVKDIHYIRYDTSNNRFCLNKDFKIEINDRNRYAYVIDIKHLPSRHII